MSVLGTTVFKVPNLGETGFKIDQVQAQKQQQRQAAIQKQLNATGAEKAYAETGMGLTGRWKQMADGYYDIWKDASIKFEMTGSAADKAAMEAAGRKLSYASTAGGTILGEGGKTYQKNKAEGFKNVSSSAKDSGDLYTGFAFGEFEKGEIVRKGNELFVKDGERLVPAFQSTYLSSTPNLNNTYMLPAVVKQGKYVNPQAFVSEFKGAISAATSIGNAQSRMLTLLEQNLKNDEFVKDVVTAFAISKNDGLGMVEDPSKLGVDTYDKIMELAQNPEIVDQAVDWYKNTVSESVPPLYKAPRPSDGGGFGGRAESNILVQEDVSVDFSVLAEEVDSEGKKTGEFVIDPDAEEKITFDQYSGLESKLQAKDITDAKRFKYKIVGVGIKDGKLFADKESSEDAGFWSTDSGKQYLKKAEQMTMNEFSRLPEDTRNSIIASYGDGKYENIEKMLSGKAVSSQDKSAGAKGKTGAKGRLGFTGEKEDKNTRELREALKSQGFSDEDIESIIFGS